MLPRWKGLPLPAISQISLSITKLERHIALLSWVNSRMTVMAVDATCQLGAHLSCPLEHLHVTSPIWQFQGSWTSLHGSWLLLENEHPKNLRRNLHGLSDIALKLCSVISAGSPKLTQSQKEGTVTPSLEEKTVKEFWGPILKPTQRVCIDYCENVIVLSLKY